jgi:hypothetical protein
MMPRDKQDWWVFIVMMSAVATIIILVLVLAR